MNIMRTIIKIVEDMFRVGWCNFYTNIMINIIVLFLADKLAHTTIRT